MGCGEASVREQVQVGVNRGEDTAIDNTICMCVCVCVVCVCVCARARVRVCVSLQA